MINVCCCCSRVYFFISKYFPTFLTLLNLSLSYNSLCAFLQHLLLYVNFSFFVSSFNLSRILCYIFRFFIIYSSRFRFTPYLSFFYFIESFLHLLYSLCFLHFLPSFFPNYEMFFDSSFLINKGRMENCQKNDRMRNFSKFVSCVK